MEPKHFCYEMLEFCCSFKAVSCFEYMVPFAPLESRTRKAQKSFGLHQLWIAHMWQDVTRIMTMHFVQQTGLNSTEQPRSCSPFVHTGTFKVSRNDTCTESWTSAWKTRWTRMWSHNNFHMSIFYISYSSQTACALHSCTHHRHVILRCVYTAEPSNSICSLLLIFFHNDTFPLGL